jgi:hypothetical protein
MYPNPANHQLNIKGDAGMYTIHNTNGGIVMSFEHNEFSTIDVSKLNSGIYFVENTSTASVSTRKLIIQ